MVRLSVPVEKLVLVVPAYAPVARKTATVLVSALPNAVEGVRAVRSVLTALV